MVARRRIRFVPLGALIAATAGCEQPDVFIPSPLIGSAAGVIDGTLTYSGPPPCTKGGHIVGAAVVLGFNVNALPAPEGLGTSAESIDVIPGDRLFGGIRDQLPTAPDDLLHCPPKNAAPVTVSGDWGLAPLPGGTYEVRGFYDLDGNFDPTFSITNLPTKGDVGGGAIENAREVLAGAAPRYRQIMLGAPDASGKLTIPSAGAHVGGVTITLGQQLPLERPVFHAAEVIDAFGKNKDPNNVVVPSDFQMKVFDVSNTADTEKSFIRLRLAAGVPSDEVSLAAKPPLSLPVGGTPAPTITLSRQDVNGDGMINADDHIPDSKLVPALLPVSVFSKLAEGSELTALSAPTVVIQGITIYKDFLSTGLAPAALNTAQPDVLVALRPAALCVDTATPNGPGVLVVSRQQDTQGHALVTDKAGQEKALSKQFGRPITIAYGCLPEGRYAMNLIYGTGQAWTVPNEAGVCAPSESASSPMVCGRRPRLPSQSIMLTVGPPGDPAYCVDHPTPDLCKPK